jgi:hypothetical protein
MSKAESIQIDKRRLYEFDRFDVDYLSVAAKFNKKTT